MTAHKNSLLAITSLIALTACATVSGHEEARSIAAQQIADVPTHWTSGAETVGPVQDGWVDAFEDPVLEGLIAEAQAGNRDLRVAAANVERSWLLAEQAGVALHPQVALSSGARAYGFDDGQTFESTNVLLQAQWELDVWGRARSNVSAAEQSALANEADYRYGQMSLAAGVARAYFLAVEAEEQRVVAQGIVDALIETERLVEVRKANGLANDQDISLAKANLANAKSALETVTQAKRDAIRALEVLLGRFPSAETFVANQLPEVPGGVPSGVPSEVLERRPDLIAAERRIAAAIDAVERDKAARLPRFTLTSTGGTSSSDLISFVSPSNVGWTTAANLVAPIFDGGQRERQVEISTVAQKAAVEAYGQAALTAFQEVENALDMGQSLSRRSEYAHEARVQSDNALRLSRIKFDVGETDLLSVLQLQQAAFQARSNELSVHRQQLEQYIGLNLALGGSWNGTADTSHDSQG